MKKILLLTTCLLGGLSAASIDSDGIKDTLDGNRSQVTAASNHTLKGGAGASPLGGGATLLFDMFPTLEKGDNFKHFALIPIKDFSHFNYAIPYYYMNSCYPIQVPLGEIRACDKALITEILTENTHTRHVAIRKFCYVVDLDKEVAEMNASFKKIAADIEKAKKDKDSKSKE